MSSEPLLPELVDALLESYRSDARAHHINRRFLPSRDAIIEITKLLLELMYPGYFGRQDLTDENVAFYTGVTLSTVKEKLEEQIGLSLCYQRELSGNCCKDTEPGKVRCDARDTTARFLRRLPELRAMLVEDVQAAYDGDPAATNLDEVILAYPGLFAISVYRIAHELAQLGVALLPRIMTEWAHAQTGADLHPGATIGRSFFIDHATGVVVGATAKIGSFVKLYQGVTLGALSHPKGRDGRVIRGEKRHPTVESRVTIYANTTVLGGQTVLGEGSTIGGTVFLTYGIPPGSKVAVKPPELVLKPAAPEKTEEASPSAE